MLGLALTGFGPGLALAGFGIGREEPERRSLPMEWGALIPQIPPMPVCFQRFATFDGFGKMESQMERTGRNREGQVIVEAGEHRFHRTRASVIMLKMLYGLFVPVVLPFSNLVWILTPLARPDIF